MKVFRETNPKRSANEGFHGSDEKEWGERRLRAKEEVDNGDNVPLGTTR